MIWLKIHVDHRVFVCTRIGSRSQSTLNTTVTDCTGLTILRGFPADPRSTEEILADELPVPDELDAMEKAAIRLHTVTRNT